MRRDHPPFFLLAGAEVVFLILLLKVGFWVYRGWKQMNETPDPDDPPGLPLPAPLAMAEPEALPEPVDEEEYRLAA
ncbi:MAG: hypothetical protein QNK05_05560 [Myxococcota bacterium]|nr:hypothetical protein [Myxococcota bacterium]